MQGMMCALVDWLAMYRNNPNEILQESIALDQETEQLERQILDVIRQLIQRDILDINYKIEHLSGGNTNILYRVSADDLSHDQYVIRLYGIGTEDFIDRSAENLIFSELSKAGISPPFIGLFKNGRVEGFIQARSLHPDEFSEIRMVRSIAKALANFHGLTIDTIDQSVGLWKKLNLFFSLAQGENDYSRTFLPRFTSPSSLGPRKC
jgi:ethanolamine kinase